MWTITKRQRIRSASLACLAGMLAGVVACSSGSQTGSSATGGSGNSASLPTLTVGLAGQLTAASEMWVADELGYFKKYGVNVDISVPGSAGTAEAAAGKIDLMMCGVVASIPAALQGRPTEIVYQENYSSAGTNLIVSAKSPYNNIMQLSGKKIAVEGVGESTYGAALDYSNYIVAHGGKKLTIVAGTSPAANDALVTSGQAQATAGLLDQFGTGIAAGEYRVLVNASTPEGEKILPTAVGNGYWGVTSVLAGKTKALTAFVAALREADLWLQDHSVQQISQVLAKTSWFPGQSVTILADQVKEDKASNAYSPTDGYISEGEWASSLSAYKAWGTGLNLSSATVSYGQHVNMSYWNAATKLMSATS
jgi:NitT/TauT family transport system substrate-binding protein